MKIVNSKNSSMTTPDTSIMRVAMKQCKAFFLLGLLSLSSSIVLAADLSTYNANNGVLTVQDYGSSDNKHYYLEFRNQGNSNFLLTGAKPLTAASGFQQPAYFNETANVVTIPSVNVNQQYYSVDLRYTGGSSFTLARADKAQPTTTNQPVNPPQNNGAVTKSTLVGKWQGSFSCSPQGETNVDVDIDDTLTAQIRVYASNSKVGAFDAYHYGTFELKNNVASLKPLDNVGDDLIAVWAVKPKNPAITFFNTANFNITVAQNNLSMTERFFDSVPCSQPEIKLTKTKSRNMRTEEELKAIELSAITLQGQGATAVQTCVNTSLQCDRYITAATELFSICENKNYFAACYYGASIYDFYSQLSWVSISVR